MIETVEIDEPLSLEDHAQIVHLAEAVRFLREQAAALLPRLRGRRVWMINSTARGGGVAEMLPKVVALLRELGVPTEWAVMGSREPEFFVLTKRLHNLIHGHGDPLLTEEEHSLYAAVSAENAGAMKRRLERDDILVIHDPQPLGMGAQLKRELGIPTVFRCHIGLDERTPETRAAWRFLRPFAEDCDHSIFSAPEYVPGFLSDQSDVIHPAIDPMSFKNRPLSATKLAGILCNAGLMVSSEPVVPLSFAEAATRLAPDGSFAPIDARTDIGLLFRPIVTQISRWDRLKGWKPLLDAFVRLKSGRFTKRAGIADRHRRRLELVRLVLAGPDPAAVADDPEAQEVLRELIDSYRDLPPSLMQDVAVISLPMASRKQNALMVNALQLCSSVIVQNSLREGFGLTVTEGMWKHGAILGSRACGIRQQIRDGIDGRLVQDAEDPDELAQLLDEMLEDLPARARWGQSAQLRVHDQFLVFAQVRRWLEVLAERADPSAPV
ncbi:MAG: glycosyltransferase [Deltaproteobacteria bacterium]|nr:MAG: glycosyltransferase [Deltaproteobacteria bacterium]